MRALLLVLRPGSPKRAAEARRPEASVRSGPGRGRWGTDPAPGFRVRILGPCCVVALVALAHLAPTPARGEEEPAPGAAPAPPAEPVAPVAGAAEEEPLTPEEATRIGKLLEVAAKKRRAQDVLPALEEVKGRSHPSFVKPLLKMLTHEVQDVALRAAEILRVQRPGDEKDAAKLAKAIWKEGFADRANDRRWVVRGRVLLAVAEQEKAPLDDRRFKEVEGMWRGVIGDPQEASAPALVDVCRYVRLVKDKRLCRMLGEEIDEPIATAPNSPSNPPAEWWERRWKLWKQVKAAVVEALEDLTGESFKSTAAAKAWFEANQREFGFKW